MKVQSRVNRRVGDKEYRKWYVDLPPDVVKEIGWRESMDLDFEIKGDKVILKPKKRQ